MARPAKKIGELLVQENMIDMKQLQLAKQKQREHGGRLVEHLTDLGYINDRDLARFFEKAYNVASIDLRNFEITSEVASLVPKDVCIKNTIIPVSKVGNTVVIASADPSNRMVLDDLRYITHSKIEIVVATEKEIKEAIDRLFGSSSNDMSEIVDEIEASDDIAIEGGEPQVETGADGAMDDPIIKFVNSMLLKSIKERASDIHVEPYEKRFRIRFRIDGVLYEKIQPPPGAAPSIISRLKILSRLNIAERRKPQDGRLAVKIGGGQKIDFRVSVLPTLFGEKVVLRLLDKSNLQLDMTKLGFEQHMLELFQKKIHQPQGMILITGPTGSGKTTTIYSALAELNQPGVNICTAEDPVEFNLDGINQVQMKHDIGLDFATALRSFLRQDPDIVMVGEIRDLETAEIGFKAASTGHLVVSTLHTNDAPATIARLLDIGIEPFLVTSTVSLIVAQRLVGKICQDCARPYELDKKVLIDLGAKPEEVGDYKLMKGEGCGYCGGIGMKGRIAIYEILDMTANLKEAVLKGRPIDEIREAALADGMQTLRMSALGKLKEGLTTVEEVVKVTLKD